MQKDQEHHPDIRAALNTLARSTPEAAGRASLALRVLLRRSYSTDASNTWNSSRLTGDGFPVEFSFTTGDTQVRYTADPGGSDLPAQERLGEALGLMAELGEPVADPGVLGYLAACQQQRAEALRYGAWVGGRHPVHGAGVHPLARDRFKLYGEVPEQELESHRSFIDGFLKFPPRLYQSAAQLTIIATEPASGRIELYLRTRQLELVDLPLLLEAAGLRQRAGELIAFVEEAYAHRLEGRIPGGSAGISYAFIPGSSEVIITLYLFTRMLWGGDSRIRRSFSGRLKTAEVNPEAYRELTASLASRDVYQTFHGLLGFSIAPSASIQLSLGVRPPPVHANGSGR
jgi:hypothetical protein